MVVVFDDLVVGATEPGEAVGVTKRRINQAGNQIHRHFMHSLTFRPRRHRLLHSADQHLNQPKLNHILKELPTPSGNNTSLGGKNAKCFHGSELANRLISTFDDLCECLDNLFAEKWCDTFRFGEVEFTQFGNALDDVCHCV